MTGQGRDEAADQPAGSGEVEETAQDHDAREAARAERERKRRLAEIFGEVLPEGTRDDADEPGEGRTSEEWLKRQVPPHHG
jgi:phage protein D